MSSTNHPISADFNFESHFVKVKGSGIHYIDEGEGQPVLFLHGNPTSSYLWRNIIPYLTPHARCIAPDLIGMGRSDKPDISYRFFDHYSYIEGFIETLGLKNITLVVHDWGSGIGFHYTAQHPENVRAIAFMEAILQTARWADFPSDFRMGFKLMRTPFIGWLMVSVMNGFVEQILPKATVRKLTDEEMAHYRAPYPTVRSRKPARQWPCEIPIEGKPADVTAAVKAYNQKLQESDIPKLLFYAHPGGLISKRTVEWCREHLPNFTAIDIGKGIHYVQEDNPHGIGEGLRAWFLGLGQG